MLFLAEKGSTPGPRTTIQSIAGLEYSNRVCKWGRYISTYSMRRMNEGNTRAEQNAFPGLRPAIDFRNKIGLSLPIQCQ